MLLAIATVLGMFGGLVMGSLAAGVTMAHHGCLLPAEAVIDPFIGILLGGWYGPVLVDWWRRKRSPVTQFQLSSTLHLFFDTSTGLFVGYHLCYGFVTYASYVLGWWEHEGVLLLGSISVTVFSGALFYWSTKRWLKRMGYDEVTGLASQPSTGLSHDR